MNKVLREEVIKMREIRLQGIYEEKEVKDLNIGDIITWNYGYQSKVVNMTPSRTGKTVTLSLESLGDNAIRSRKMKTTTSVVA